MISGKAAYLPKPSGKLNYMAETNWNNRDTLVTNRAVFKCPVSRAKISIII